ncbi:MAG: MATE family efflux transporter [Clostridia bacterium]|nr:MATE family efflux transporter [Clostridia bacterium]
MFTRKQVWTLIIPLMIEQVLTSLMGTVDTMMVSNAGEAAVSAVSLVDTLNILLIYLFSAMATGGAIICAQYLGRKEKAEANETGRQLMLTVGAISVALMLVCALLRGPLLRLIFGEVEAEVMKNARNYLLITALSYPFIALYNAGAALFRVDGNSRLPMAISLSSNIINIAGNAVLIFGFKLGVVGAASATLAAHAYCTVMIFIFLRQPRQAIVIRDYRRLRPRWDRIRSIMFIGLPTGIENGMFQVGKLAIQSTVSTLGTTAIAAHAMTSALEGFLSHAQVGIGLGLMTIVGQCMGAGRVDEARKYILRLTGYCEIVTIVMCGVVAALAQPIALLAGLEAESARLMKEMVYALCIFKPLTWTLSFIPAYGFRAAGDVRFPMIVSTITMFGCRVVTAIALMRFFGFGPIAVWIGMFVDWGVRGIVFSWRFFSMRWAEKKVIQG